MPTQLSLHDLTKSYDHRLVLDQITCAFPPGQVSGLIGENGSGKSTLLRIAAGLEPPTDGSVIAAGSIGFLAQDNPLPLHCDVAALADHALADLRRIESRLRELEQLLAVGNLEVLDEYGELQTAFEVREGYDADARLARATHGLGLSDLPGDRVLSTLSGGELARLHLAAVLASSPEILLLDEPTNHLDISAATWLEDHLRARRGTTVVVSHDRAFLERVASTLFEVDGDTHRITRHGNGYQGYLTEKAAERARLEQARQLWEDEVAAMRVTVRTTADRVSHRGAMKDNNKVAYDRATGRVNEAERSKIRNAKERLRRRIGLGRAGEGFRCSHSTVRVRGFTLRKEDRSRHAGAQWCCDHDGGTSDSGTTSSGCAGGRTARLLGGVDRAVLRRHPARDAATRSAARGLAAAHRRRRRDGAAGLARGAGDQRCVRPPERSAESAQGEVAAARRSHHLESGEAARLRGRGGGGRDQPACRDRVRLRRAAGRPPRLRLQRAAGAIEDPTSRSTHWHSARSDRSPAGPR
jgi:ABC-type multidrug transport system ATPase subunit